MTKKTRYILLGLGFVFFLVLAPLIVLYVRGITYDFASQSFVQTGILAVRSEPSDASIFLNNKLVRTNSGDIKFLAPGEYQVALKKDGYLTWGKRLTVSASQVAWANPNNNNIFLFFSSPKSQNLASGVVDFYTLDGRIAFLTPENISLTSLSASQKSQSFALPQPANKILTANGNNFLLTDLSTGTLPSLLLFNSQTGNFTDLSGLFAKMPKLQFSQNGDLFALSDNFLYKIDAATKTKNALLSGVKAFYFLGDSLYYLAEKNNEISLNLSQAPFSQSQLLLSGVQEFSEGRLMVTFEKQIFLLADGNLYKANSSMEKIADGVSELDFDQANSILSVLHGGQFDYYDAYGQNLNFVTRSGNALNNLLVKNNIGYAFYISGLGLNAIELDTRDSQNSYILLPSPTLQKFSIDSSGENILVLDGSELKNLQIR